VRPLGTVTGAAVLIIASTACLGGRGPSLDPVASPVIGEPVVYVAIGASEMAGVGTDEPFRQAWPKVLWRDALPEAVFYDLGRPGSTLAEALVEQAGEAAALRPDLVTVWLNVNDLVEQVPATAYEADLRQLLTMLDDSTDAAVLVASTPRIDSLPLYLACRPDPPLDSQPCPALGVSLPSPSHVRAAVERYNAAIGRVAAEVGAIVVDLEAFGDAPAEHPEWIAADGFHPSAEGAIAIASAFAEAVPARIVAAAAAAPQ